MYYHINIMDDGGIREIILQVISSWQVIVVTVVILLYIVLVNFVSASRYRKRQSSPRPRPRKAKKKKGSSVDEVGDDSELGLE